MLPEACGSKIIAGGVMGAIIGVAMGVFMGAMGDVSPIQIVNGREVPQAPLREQMRAALKATASKAGGWARNFGVLTALFGGVECVIEKYRAKHDVWNPAVSGCIVGATLAAKGGPGVRHVAHARARNTHTQLLRAMFNAPPYLPLVSPLRSTLLHHDMTPGRLLRMRGVRWLLVSGR